MGKLQKNKYSFSSIKPLIVISDEVIEARNEQISRFTAELIEYKVLLRDLISYKISYTDKNEVLNIAMFITEEVELYEDFINNKDIPIGRLCSEENLDKSFIEKYREYIIAYVLILGNPTYKSIQDYLQIRENIDAHSSTGLIKYEHRVEVDGVIIAKSKKSAIILTIMGEFKKIKLPEGAIKGDEVEAKERKRLSDYKLYISLISIFIVVFILVFVYSYNNIKSTIVIETTSTIRLDINGFNRVVSATSPTEKGKVLVEETNVLDKEIDDAIYMVLEYANNNEMLKSGGIVVTITGKPLKYDALVETEKYIYEKGLKVRFNNSGMEHRLE